MKKAVITGATGFIGTHLCELLLENNIEVIGVDINEEKLDKFSSYKNFTSVKADFSLYDNLDSLIQANDIDVFYHLAWNGVNTIAFRDGVLQLDNAINSVKALDAAIKLKCKKFVNAGTYNEFEIQTIANLDEYDARYTNIYGAAKFAGDMILRAKAKIEGIEYSAGLVSMVYGEGITAPNLVNVVLQNFCQRKPSKLVKGDNLYDLIYVKDVARAFMYIGEKGKDMTRYYVGHKDLKTFKEQITLMRDILSPQSELRFGEYLETQTLDFSKVDTYKLYRDTGFECTADFEETIKSTYEWVKGILIRK